MQEAVCDQSVLHYGKLEAIDVVQTLLQEGGVWLIVCQFECVTVDVRMRG